MGKQHRVSGGKADEHTRAKELGSKGLEVDCEEREHPHK